MSQRNGKSRTEFPLNSKRLKIYQLQQLAQALELPIIASSDDLRAMIEEKLRAMDKNPPDTQVVVDVEKEPVTTGCRWVIFVFYFTIIFTVTYSSNISAPVEELPSELSKETLEEVKNDHPQEY